MVSLTIISPTRRYQETRLQDHFDKCHRLNCVARLFKKNKNKELLRLGKILCIMCGFQYTSISGLLDLIKCPDTTHRLWCVALPRSARSVCAPGCHSVQKSAQEDPAESRQTDHRVEVTGHFWHSALTDFYVTPVCSLLTALSPSPLKFKKKKPLPVASWLTCAARLEDHSAPSPFPTLSAAAVYLFLSETFSLSLNSLRSWSRSWKSLWRVSAVRSESLERLDWERGRWDDLRTPPIPPQYNTHTHRPLLLLRGGSAGSGRDDRFAWVKSHRKDPKRAQSECSLNVLKTSYSVSLDITIRQHFI